MIKIGICDDEKVCRKQLKEMLEQFFQENGLDFELWEYESGTDFLNQGEEIHLLFLDIEMEGMSGIQLKDTLKWREDIRIVFVTSHVEEMPEAFGRNVYGFLEKPVTADKLEKYLLRVLEDLEEEQFLVIKGVQGEMFCDMGLQQLEEMLGQKFICKSALLMRS